VYVFSVPLTDVRLPADAAVMPNKKWAKRGNEKKDYMRKNR
jgi:hypothetical protein